MSSTWCVDLGSFDGNQAIVRKVWGDHNSFQVFVEVLYKEKRNIFRYSTDPTLKQSLQSRIVTYYHGHRTADVSETFVDRNTFREALLRSIMPCWDHCSSHPCLGHADVVIEIYEDQRGMSRWRLSHLSIYEHYREQLWPLSTVLSGLVPMHAYKGFQTVGIGELVYYGGFPGRGNNKMVGLRSRPKAEWVFKGLDLVKYLMTGSAFPYRRDACYNEIRTIFSLPSHPNIISNFVVYVTAADMSPEPGICGALYPYIGQTLKDEINTATNINVRLGLAEKAKWCFQMASAIVHTHHKANQYHMDIRPSKFLVDSERNIVLIDWEQSGASRCTIAPEADGSYDAETRGAKLQAKTIYRVYGGPERANNPHSWPRWNVFPIWRNKCPEALEYAEIFSLGRAMWMLVEQVDEGDPAIKIETCWKALDIPLEWGVVIQRCLEPDPNRRLTLREVMGFWEKEMGRHSLPKPSDS